MRWFDHGAFEAERPFCGSLCQRSQSPEMVHTGRAVSSWVKLLRYLHLWCAAPDCPLLYIWGQKVLKNLTNPVLSSSKKCSKKEDGPLQWKLVNFSGLSNSYKILALHVWCCSNSLKTLKQMGCEESHGDMELSQKEQHLTQTCASSDAAQQHLVSAREVSPCRAHTRQTTSSMLWEQMSGRKKQGTGPWKLLWYCFFISRKEWRKLLSIATQICTKWSKGSPQHHVSMSCKNSQNPLWRVFHLWFIWVCLLLHFPRPMLCYFFP